MAAADITTMTTTTTTTPTDYGDQIPLTFMDVNYGFAVFMMVALAFAAVIGIFGNTLILVTVATQRQFRSVETIFIVNLACCDLTVTLVAEPLSIIAKLVGWRMFEGVPGACKAIGYLCTLSCMGSLATLGIMSLNRYVLICHHTLYARIFSARNCLILCFGIYVFGFFILSLNWLGIGDHSFDYKSFECVWDRMASHDYTVGFSLTVVWIPICVTGLCYGRTYWYVRKARAAIANRRKAAMPSKSTPSDNVSQACRLSDKPSKKPEAVDRNKTQNAGEQIRQAQAAGTDYNVRFVNETVKGYQVDIRQIQTSVASQNVSDEGDGKTDKTLLLQVSSNGDVNSREFSIIPATNSDNKSDEASQKTTAEEGQSTNTTKPLTEKEESTNTTKISTEKEASTNTTKPSTAVNTPVSNTSAAEKAEKSATSGQAGMKLARPLFIIYVVFCTCWIPYSLTVMSDSEDTFPHELHAFITAFAHLNSSINWLVYYHTHMKMRRAFQRVLSCRRHKNSSSVQPLTTSGPL